MLQPTSDKENGRTTNRPFAWELQDYVTQNYL